MYNVYLKTPAASSLFPLELVKQYVRIEEDSDDKIILISLKFAESYAERITKKVISPKVYIIETDEIIDNSIKINLSPVNNVISVKSEGLDISYSLPERNTVKISDFITTCTIEVQCGLSVLDEISPQLQIAILSHSAYHYNNRFNENGPLVPQELQEIYRSFREINIL